MFLGSNVEKILKQCEIYWCFVMSTKIKTALKIVLNFYNHRISQ